jgi:hypothetical protein
MRDSTPSSIETGATKAHSTGDQLDVTHVENQDDFNPDSYQNSLGTIIIRMSDAVVPEDVKGYEHSYPGSDRFFGSLIQHRLCRTTPFPRHRSHSRESSIAKCM